MKELQDKDPYSTTFQTLEEFKMALNGPPKSLADELQEFVPDPEAVASSLNIAVKHAAEADYEGSIAPQTNAFDLGRLKDVEDYLEETENDAIIYLKPLDNTIAECQKTFTQFHGKDILSKAESLTRIEKIEKLNTSMLNIAKHFIYDLQTFNIDKRWEVPGRSLFKIREGLLKSLDANGPEREEELILLDMFNDPQHVAISAHSHRAIQERNTKEEKHGKKSSPVAKLLERIRDSFDDVGAAAGTWNDVMGRMADLPPALSWEKMIKHNPGLSRNLPKRIRQYFLELVFLRSELHSLQFEIVYMIYFLRELLKVWWRAGEDAWEFGKKHVYVMPHFREYEFTRHALLSTQYLILRLDYKIAKFSRSSEGRKYNFPNLYGDLKENTCDSAWKGWSESVSEELLSPEELMGRMEREERVKEDYWEEQRVLAEELKKQMMENLRETRRRKDLMEQRVLAEELKNQMVENLREAKKKGKELTKQIAEQVRDQGKAAKTDNKVTRKGKVNA